MKLNTLSKKDSKDIMDRWGTKPLLNNNLNEEEKKLRESIKKCMLDTLAELEISNESIKKNSYKVDLMFGIKLFYFLQKNTNTNPKIASDSGIWRYLSMVIAPDIVYDRWEKKPDRFWNSPRRIWFKSLWWYIYLSWQGTIESTYDILKNNTTDEIVQLVERVGNGYRVNLYREIMRVYGELDINLKKNNSDIFRKIMKLNTAMVSVIEPSLMDGGEKEYVKELFEYCIKK